MVWVVHIDSDIMGNPIKKAIKMIADPILAPVKEPFSEAKKLGEKAGDILKNPLGIAKKK